jgi:hypothetical protein
LRLGTWKTIIRCKVKVLFGESSQRRGKLLIFVYWKV